MHGKVDSVREASLKMIARPHSHQSQQPHQRSQHRRAEHRQQLYSCPPRSGIQRRLTLRHIRCQRRRRKHVRCRGDQVHRRVRGAVVLVELQFRAELRILPDGPALEERGLIELLDDVGFGGAHVLNLLSAV